MIRINSYGEQYIELSKQEKLDAIKRWGSVDAAAFRLDVNPETVRHGVGVKEYGEYIRNPPVISSELYNQEVTRAW